ncbi:Uma2 family endonuclease [Azospirillum sp.]|uniref:Uma2 family endonuclease n=1 Tax=Azospirillum sp. TaxID=34012 RepID=UPI003D73463F
MPPDTLPATTDFLAWARRNGGRAEFVNGTAQHLPAGSLAHDTICGNLFAALHAGADGIERHVFLGALVEVPGVGYLSPDLVFGTWSPSGEEVHVRGPQLVVEVTSPDTAARDRGFKWKAMQTVAALERYVLVDEAEWSVEVFARGADDGWRYERLTGTEDVLSIPSFGFAMPLAAVYRGVFRA